MNLLRALSTVSGMTLLSRVTGLARESLKAAAFGAGMQMDAFEAAFRNVQIGELIGELIVGLLKEDLLQTTLAPKEPDEDKMPP